jgi:hypothetical protein
MYGPLGFLFDLPFGNVTDQFDKNPTEIWIAARTAAAALCMAGVAATYWAARRLWGVREGLVAAARAGVRVPAGRVLARGGHGRGAR